MTTALEHQADQIIRLSREIERLEAALTYEATTIATLAAGDEMGTGFFRGAVKHYKTLTNELREAKQAYAETLKGEN